MQQSGTKCEFYSSDSWVILSPIEQSIKRKIEAVGTPLKDWDIQINYGIKTGYNDAFIIDTAKRDEILANCQSEDERERTAELIRPILRGRDIKRYGYNWAGLYLIATFPSRHYDIEQYPAVKEYLLSFGIERLEQTGKEHNVNGEKIKARKKTCNKWFETQDSISYWEDFNKPKIVWGEISDRSKFAFEAYGSFIPEATTFLMVGSDLSYLLCVLNSPLSEWFFSKVGTTTGVGTVRWKKYTIQELLIPFVNVKLRQLFQQIVEKYVIGNITSEQLSKYSNKILYEVVGLIDEEIEFVEDFSKPKMLWKRVGSILRFCYNDNETLGLDSTCFATGENIEFICCVLNSPMGHYLLKDAPKTGTGDLLVSVQAIEPIQIPQVGLETNSEFKKLLEPLIKTDSPSNEKEISRKVLKLYDLSLDEQSYIETNFT